MNVGYFCRNTNCLFPGQKPFLRQLNIESIMDMKNIADIFCPYCNEKLVPEDTKKR